MPRCAFLLRTSLVKLALVGLLLQGHVLSDAEARSRAAAPCIAPGSVLFRAFGDLEDRMLASSLPLLARWVATRPREPA